MPLELNHRINTSTTKSERIMYEHARRMFRKKIRVVCTIHDGAR
jgi:hypothetical protein